MKRTIFIILILFLLVGTATAALLIGDTLTRLSDLRFSGQRLLYNQQQLVH